MGMWIEWGEPLASVFHTASPAADAGGGVPVLSRVRECVRGPPGVHKKLHLHCNHYLYFGVRMVKTSCMDFHQPWIFVWWSPDIGLLQQCLVPVRCSR